MLVVARLDRLARSMRQLLTTDIGQLIDPVQKSPSLIVAESWLPTVVSSVMLTVSRTMLFSATPATRSGVHPVQADHPDRLVDRVVRVDEVLGGAGEIGREIGRRASLLMASATLSRLTTLTGAWSGWSGWSRR